MKLLLKTTLPLLVVALAFACGKKADNITVTGKIGNAPDNKVKLTSEASGYDTELELDENGTFNIEVPLTEPDYFQFRNGREFGVFYARPGDEISFELNAEDFDNTITFTGGSAAENSFLAKKVIFDQEQRKAFGYEGYMDQDESTFLSKLNEKQALYNKFIDDSSEGLDKNLLETERSKVVLKGYSDRFMYPQYYKYMNKSEIELSDDFYAFVDEVDINDENLIKTQEGNNVLTSVIQHKNADLSYQEDGPIDYFLGLFSRVKEQISNKKVKANLLYGYLDQKLSYGGGLDGITDEIDYFKSIADDEKKVAEIDKMVEVWSALKRGNDAPQFAGVTAKGEKVNLADLKGKNVYVDVWATWCGPCKAEIPHLKEVERKYHDGNIEFVSISIDEQKDKEKWAKFIVDNELGGVQLFADGAWQSDVANNYNIKGIPRFILIKDDGKIYSADAPRPSDDNRLNKAFEEMGVCSNC